MNPWLQNPQYNCFGCCPSNPFGMHMRFYEEGDDVVSIWQPKQQYQSWVNTLHGGVQAVLLDEVCGWVVFHKLQTAGVTAKMDIHYRKPVSTLLPYIELRARVKEQKRQVFLIEGEIRDPDGQVLCDCICTYFTFPQDKAMAEMGYLPSSLGEEDEDPRANLINQK